MRSLWVFFLTILAFNANASEEFRPALEDARLDSTFLPIGFDSNDRVQLVVSGTFKNTCYQVGPHKAKVEGTQIVVDQKVYHYNGLCLQVTVPFHQVIELDELLETGHYTVVDKTTGKKLGVLPVKKAETDLSVPGPDEHSYAPVSDAFVVRDGASGKNAVVLRGVFPNSCIEFQKIEPHAYSDQVVVLPIVVKDKNRNDCQDGAFPYEERKILPDVKAKSFLLHVRSMNGQGINKVIEGLTN